MVDAIMLETDVSGEEKLIKSQQTSIMKV